MIFRGIFRKFPENINKTNINRGKAAVCKGFLQCPVLVRIWRCG